jgi:hypothetical protein
LIVVVHTDHPDLETLNVTPQQPRFLSVGANERFGIQAKSGTHKMYCHIHILDAADHNHKALTMMHWIYIHAKVCKYLFT